MIRALATGIARLVALAGLVVAGAALSAGASPSWAATNGAAAVVFGAQAAVDLLERSREAAQSEAFTGTVVVQWHEGRRRHTEQVPVRSARGVMHLGDDVVGAGSRRLVHGPDGWLTLWGHDVAALGPSPTAKYSFSTSPGPRVAGRPTDMVEVRLGSPGGRLRERLYFDQTTELVLRRELLDARGKPYRSVAFATISAARGSTPAASPHPARSQEPVPARRLDDSYAAPKRLGAGYQLMGTYAKGQGVIQLFYSDGLHGLSVFEQRGRLTSMAALGRPGSGKEVEIAGHSVRAYSASVGDAAVWEGDGVVFTAVSDAPWADLAAAIGDLPHAEPPGRLRRLAQVVVSLLRWK